MPWARAALCLALVLAVLPGCADLPKPIVFLQHRFEDLCETAEVGFTITFTPQWGFYWNSLDIFPVGYSKIDGYFIGIGGGGIGIRRHWNECYGFGVGIEKIGWSGNLNPNEPIPDEKIMRRMSGILGILSAILGIAPYGSGPNYTPACVHFVPHIGYVGLVWNARYTEFVDFALGWVGLDISGDDGRAVGRWNIPGLTPKWDEEQEKAERKTGSGTWLPGFLRPSCDDATSEKPTGPAPEPQKPASGGWSPGILEAVSQAARDAKSAQAGTNAEKPKEPAPPPAARQRVYVVRPGDTGLLQIAEEQLGGIEHWYRIAERNNLKPPYEIRPGQKLILPE